MRTRVIFLFALPAAAGLALIAWGLYLWFHKPVPGPGNYNQARTTINGHTLRTEVVDTMATRELGLSGRLSMKQDEAMLFIFPVSAKYSFWMKDMHFPLDMVWIKGDVVVDITADVPPPAPGAGMLSLPNYSPSVAVDRVLEVNAGLSAKHGWKAGDKVSVVYN